ncbi:ammonium transporter [Corynebacterium sp. 320]|uniref:ammonium transporter n=1 Tax=Corynebacterium TaxID=1716 RepID=UPI00125CB958|nr:MULTISPECIES: ammonium transporter [Corynebacterium]KAB1503833.1 ammonium transporter [Corynebacterium sp. 320]KAB1553066.1 ammonium transporter [Corynebacterium sp. 321]KAB1553714.1 ammonium transporter [Corynebacterium sp. 319]KAB3527969.1 ammonium transporter [Corynebacterium sp. 250]KAB3540541.1 ammonium transporter [Corynebacterium sp. 366]
MTPEQISLASGNSAWMLVSAALVLLMTPALALFYGGMSRQKSALNMMMMVFGSMGVVGVLYMLWGWSMSYGTQSIAGIFSNPLEFFGLTNAIVDSDGKYVVGANGYANVIDIAFQVTFAMITVAIIAGSLANRVKFRTWMVFVAIWITASYFPMAHMVWGGGWLGDGERSVAALLFGTHEESGELVANIQPIDFAGGTVVHINAGVAGLVLAIIIGRSMGFMETKERPHNLPLVMLGAALLWFGWFGFNAGSAFAADGMAGLAWVNTTASTCAAMLGWLAVERIRDKHVTSLGAASGVVAGLVTITPAAGDMTPLTSIIIGFIGGMLAAVGVGMKYVFKFDDSLDVVGLHLVAGVWGTIACGLFATDTGLFTGGGVEGAKLLVVQILITVIAAVYCAVVTTVIALILKKTLGWRISSDEESVGIDTSHHGEEAYNYEFQDSSVKL